MADRPGAGDLRGVGDAHDAGDPHGDAEVLTAGAPLDRAAAALVLAHGRGGTAAGLLEMAGLLERPGLAMLAPQAAGGSWYPHSFLAPLEQNEPWLSSALGTLGRVLGRLAGAGIPQERVALLGFSQGGCLFLEFAARNPRRYGGVVGLSAGLIGPEVTPRGDAGSLEGTPVFLGCSDIDPHVPLARVRESAEAFRRMGAEVEERIYPGMGHTVNRDEIEFVTGMLARFAPGGGSPGAR